MSLEHGEKVLNTMEDIKIAMLQRSAEQRESTLAWARLPAADSGKWACAGRNEGRTR